MSALFGCYSYRAFNHASECEHIVSQLYHNDYYSFILPNLILLQTVWHTNGNESQFSSTNDLCIISTSHLTNKSELYRKLNLPPETSEQHLILSAYRRWESDCCHHIQGQWVFAVYSRKNKTLFIGRDPSTQTPLYYYHGNKTFVFSTSIKTLLASSFVPKKFNHHAVFMPSGLPHGDETLYQGIYHITPATTIRVDKQMELKKDKYWSLNDIQPIRYSKTQDYVDAFLEVYSKAVQDSISPDLKNAVTLSSGLDSNSIVAIAAPFLKDKDKSLYTYTFIPKYDGSNCVSSSRYPDESQLIKEAYQSDSNLCKHFIQGSPLSIIESLKLNLDICQEPASGANIDNRLGLLQQMNKDGIANILVGQYGNFTISYTGELPRHLILLLKNGHIIDYIKTLRCSILGLSLLQFAGIFWQQLKNVLPERVESKRRFNRMLSFSFLHKNIIDEHKVLAKKKITKSSIMRFIPHNKHWNHHLRNINNWVEWGASWGIRVHDPTADNRVVEFCIGVPQWLFDRKGQKKFLYKQAMKNLVYPKILLNQKRGLQASDIIKKIRMEKNDIRDAMNSIKGSSLCQAYLDIPKMEDVWTDILDHESPELHLRAHMILLRGIHYGLFLKQFEDA